MHVAVIAAVPCFPPNAGNRSRIYNIVSRLASRHRITYFCRHPGNRDEVAAATAEFDRLGIKLVMVEDPLPARSGPLFLARVAANLMMSPLPYSAASLDSPRLRAAIVAEARRDPFDLCHVEWLGYAEGLRAATGAPTLIATHDVVTLLWQRHLEMQTHPAKSWYVRGQMERFRRLERRLCAEADAVTAVSAEDARYFHEAMGIPKVGVVENGVDTDYFGGVVPAHEPDRVLFLGTLESRPNLDGVEQLLDTVFPALQAKRPAVQLDIVGRNPPVWLERRAAATPGVELHASVPDVRPFLARASVMAVPLRIGGGTRLKILEALAAGLPVVSTRVGAEALALESGRHLTICDDVEDLADGLAASLADQAAAEDRTAAGRRVVLDRYGWNLSAAQLDRIWQETVAAPVPARSHVTAADTMPSTPIEVASPNAR